MHHLVSINKCSPRVTVSDQTAFFLFADKYSSWLQRREYSNKRTKNLFKASVKVRTLAESLHLDQYLI